ncbi:SCO2322 family protein [Streptomyces celluloflavus]|uniref:SCO2322 family protein n=1 Tax=Streptomyces celluloflavus TaxID=58344 RepID=UPI0036D871B0
MRRTRTLSRRARILGTLLLAGALTGLGAAPAQAQEYRYWSFWDGKGGSWAYATEGPATLRPADGAVAGFRFTVSADSAAAGTPRAAADFDAICAKTPAKDGDKRIGVVIDFGTAADAPGGETPPQARTECARIPKDASAGDALAAVARPLRYDSNALLCAIAGYPKSGCADQVSGSGDAGSGASASSPSSSSAPAASSGSGTAADGGGGDGGGPSAGLLGGIAAVVVLGAAAVWQARRRRG